MTQRTNQQNKAMHLYFRMLAEALNDAGYDMKKTLKPEIEIPWTPEMVKEHLWKPIQKIMMDKESTTEMETMDPDEVYRVLDRFMADKFGISVDWPSWR